MPHEFIRQKPLAVLVQKFTIGFREGLDRLVQPFLFLLALFGLINNLWFSSYSTARAALPPISFEVALDRWVNADPKVKTARAQEDAVRARQLTARGAFLPALSINSSQTWTNPNYTAFDFTASGNVFRWGADALARGLIQKEFELVRASILSEELRSEAGGARLFFSWIQNHLELETYRNLVLAQRLALGAAQKRFEKGLIPEQEVFKIRVDLDHSEARVDAAEEQEYKLSGEVAEILEGVQLQFAWPWTDRLESLSVSVKTDLEGDLPVVPEVLYQQLSSEIEAGKLEGMRRSLLPRLEASLSLGYVPKTNWGAGVSPSEWGLTLRVSLPLFEQWSSLGQSRLQEVALFTTETHFGYAVRASKARREAFNKRLPLLVRAALKRQELLKTARSIHEMGRLGFESGRINANDLVLDQNRLVDSEVLAIRSWSEAHTAAVHSCHAAGKRAAACIAQP